MKVVAWIGIGLGALILWLLAASFLYCLVSATFSLKTAWMMFIFPWDQWLQFAPYANANWLMATTIILTGLLPALFIGLFVWRGLQLRRQAMQGLYGKSHMAATSDLRNGGLSVDRKPW